MDRLLCPNNLLPPTLSLKVPPLFLILPHFWGYGTAKFSKRRTSLCKTLRKEGGKTAQAHCPMGLLCKIRFWWKSNSQIPKYLSRTIDGAPKKCPKKFSKPILGVFL